jgi:hypothetical protein
MKQKRAVAYFKGVADVVTAGSMGQESLEVVAAECARN